MRPDVSVIIPMHDAAATIDRLVTSLLAIEVLDVEVVVVDDASTDGSADRVAAPGHERVVVARLPTNQGAGIARNRGFALARGRYSLFFDADDEIHPGALATAVRGLDETSADVAFLPYRYRRGHVPHEGMNVFDLAAWGRYATSPRRLTRLSDVPQLLGFSSYPWNKVLRTDHYRRRGLRFSGTPVHNDILGHWLTLLDAGAVLLVDDPLCTHIVAQGGRNLTNRESRARLSLLDALDETYTELERRPDKRLRYAHHYWDFVLRVGGWATTRLTPDVMDEFNAGFQRHLLRMDLGDFSRMRLRRDPLLAELLVRRSLA
jgi:glycosyltransferase involved in cell wall biosynthesis